MDSGGVKELHCMVTQILLGKGCFGRGHHPSHCKV